MSYAPLPSDRTFLQDVVDGLTSSPKRLSSKYFYDAAGDQLFQQIMRCPEYYLTRCEEEIIVQSAGRMVGLFAAAGTPFDLVELGAGDATKTVHLLQRIFGSGLDCCYYPIDISASVISTLERKLPDAVPGIVMQGMQGEYLQMLDACCRMSGRRKVVMFMGANIGNMAPAEAAEFCLSVRKLLQPGDMVLIGFDLVKDPSLILSAYNDSAGFTRAFNLNLLRRINRELAADFDPESFYHYPVYDPGTGACKSFLVSRSSQKVRIGMAEKTFDFAAGEAMQTEISQKYSHSEIAELATASGFYSKASFTDRQGYCLVAAWSAE